MSAYLGMHKDFLGMVITRLQVIKVLTSLSSLRHHALALSHACLTCIRQQECD